jgi:hypothetical protein
MADRNAQSWFSLLQPEGNRDRERPEMGDLMTVPERKNFGLHFGNSVARRNRAISRAEAHNSRTINAYRVGQDRHDQERDYAAQMERAAGGKHHRQMIDDAKTTGSPRDEAAAWDAFGVEYPELAEQSLDAEKKGTALEEDKRDLREKNSNRRIMAAIDSPGMTDAGATRELLGAVWQAVQDGDMTDEAGANLAKIIKTDLPRAKRLLREGQIEEAEGLDHTPDPKLLINPKTKERQVLDGNSRNYLDWREKHPNWEEVTDVSNRAGLPMGTRYNDKGVAEAIPGLEHMTEKRVSDAARSEDKAETEAWDHEILSAFKNGEPLTENQQKYWNERAKLDPIAQLMNQMIQDRQQTPKKPELSDDDMATIRASVKQELADGTPPEEVRAMLEGRGLDPAEFGL